MDCIFCEIINEKIKAHFVYEDDSHIAILDRYPIQIGHTLVIPREHHHRIIDMPNQNVSLLFSKIPAIARGILQATSAEGFNVGQNNGIAANQIIPHVHVHIIPRYVSIGAIWTKRIIAHDKDLADLALKIKNCIKLG